MSDEPTTLRDLKPDPQNRRLHTERNLGMLVDALHAVGAARSIVIDERNTVLAGNGVVDAAAEAGIERVRVVDVDGETLVAVRRRGLTDEQKRALSIYDNRVAELAAWNVNQLKLDAAADLSLQPFWSEAEQAILIGDGVKPEWKGMPEFEQQDETAFRTIKVHCATQADVDAFAALVAREFEGQTVTDKTRYLWYPRAEAKTVDVVYAGRDDEDAPS